MTGLRSMPVLPVRDVVAAADFYEALGFDRGRIWGDPPAFCIMGLGTVTVALQRGEANGTRDAGHWSAYIYVEDVSSLYRQFRSKGGDVSDLRRDNPYGCDDFDLTDPDGNTVAFGQDMQPGPLGPGL